ncbi:MAG: hypothetical protein JWN95_3350 [Frankiales bacterium]|nr:hypothetical protein [Frankiales bacterium]
MATTHALDAAPTSPLTPIAIALSALSWARTAGVEPDDESFDGVWRPGSLNLCDELPGLLTEVALAGHRISHILFNPSIWTVRARTLTVPDTNVRLGAISRGQATSLTLIDNTTWHELNLLVVTKNST